MPNKFLAIALTLGFCLLLGACQARRDIEDDQASGDDRIAAVSVVAPIVPSWCISVA